MPSVLPHRGQDEGEEEAMREMAEAMERAYGQLGLYDEPHQGASTAHEILRQALARFREAEKCRKGVVPSVVDD